jgi:hypothetical protein
MAVDAVDARGRGVGLLRIGSPSPMQETLVALANRMSGMRCAIQAKLELQLMPVP